MTNSQSAENMNLANNWFGYSTLLLDFHCKLAIINSILSPLNLVSTLKCRFIPEKTGEQCV